MAEPEDIEKLLREIDAMNAGNSQGSIGAGPAGSSTPQKAAPAPQTTAGGKGAWVGAATIGAGATGMVAGMLLPYLGMFQSGIGAAIGGVVVSLVGQPPGWFSRNS
jgi:hypothetical protein